MHFGENQLSRCLIGLSPLSTGHPPSFQPRWVRPSTRSYPRFSLPMDRSHRFGSRTSNSTPYSDSLSLRLPVNRLTLLLIANSPADRKSTRLNSSHANISYAVFCLKKKKNK